MGNGIQLMFPQGNFRVHAAKSDMAAIILAGTGGVHFLVVLAHQSLAALRVFPDPVFECFPDSLLLLSGQSGLLSIKNPAFFSVRILNGVINSHITQV